MIEEGDAAEVILQAAHQHDVQLIVLGSHGRTGLLRLVLGSVAESVLCKSGCPVLVVPPKRG